MLKVGLTGGIGSGKSTVARLLADRGAVVIDADALAREVVAPGTPGLAEVITRFGAQVRAPDGSLDRPALGSVVFADEAARRDLEAITHPRIRELTQERMAAAPAEAVVVHDVPLLVESGLAEHYDVVVVVLAGADVRLARLRERGLPEAAARERMSAQADDAARRAVADHVLDNSGGLPELEAQVNALWTKLR